MFPIKKAARRPLLHVVIGCGGVGSWLLPLMARSVSDKNLFPDGSKLVLVDGDTLEPHNLERQVFDLSALGTKKSAASLTTLTAALRTTTYNEDLPSGGGGACLPVTVEAVERYFESDVAATIFAKAATFGGVVIWVAADNHTARFCALLEAEKLHLSGVPTLLVSAANELESAEAWVYNPALFADGLHPLRLWPEIQRAAEDGDVHDPLHACTGAAAEERAPQLALSNYLAAGLAMRLVRTYTTDYPFTDAADNSRLNGGEESLNLPVRLRVNSYRGFADRGRDLLAPPPAV